MEREGKREIRLDGERGRGIYTLRYALAVRVCMLPPNKAFLIELNMFTARERWRGIEKDGEKEREGLSKRKKNWERRREKKGGERRREKDREGERRENEGEGDRRREKEGGERDGERRRELSEQY